MANLVRFVRMSRQDKRTDNSHAVRDELSRRQCHSVIAYIHRERAEKNHTEIQTNKIRHWIDMKKLRKINRWNPCTIM